ncbi:unnamed protein product [Schistosoma rodhaini]|nr:unnamed protein product [Schistosoma rodhaini]
MGCNEFVGVDVVDELESYIERQIRGVESQKNLNSISAFDGGKSKVRITLDRHSANIVSKAVKKLSCELDQVVSRTYNHPHNGKIRITSIIQDFEKTVTDMCKQYSVQVSKARNHPSLSSIKLGSVYAWAREQSGANFNDLQMCSDLRKNRLRLCQKLSRLVRLSKSSKQQSQCHPLLVSLRHDLMKIRSRVTGKVFTEKPVIMTLPSDSTFVSFEKPIVQSKLAVVFERLADQITDLLLPISHLIPGISIVKCADDVAKRRENLRAQVILAIHGFYCHFNEISEDNTYEFKQNNSIVNDDPMNGSFDLSDGSESGSDDNDMTGAKLITQLSPAIVQASLDRFDHFNWNKQKQRSSSNRSKEQTMEQQSINNIRQTTSSYVKSSNINEKMKLTQSTMDNGNVEKLIETNVEDQFNNDISMESDSEIIRTEEDEIQEKEGGENNQSDTDEERQNKTTQHSNKSTKSHSNSSKNLVTTDSELNKHDQITDLYNESLEFCAKQLNDLIILAKNKQNNLVEITRNPLIQSKICLSNELEASIERTATAFKDHIDSVLNNLLHSASVSKSSNDDSKSHSQHLSARRQHVPSRRGSRLRGMLLAYQQDAVKKRLSSNNSD